MTEEEVKGTSLIKWQTGEPKEEGMYLVSLLDGKIEQSEIYKFRILAYEGLHFYPHRKEEVKAWCKLSDIEPYKEE